MCMNNIYFSEFASADCFETFELGNQITGQTINKYFTRTKISEEQLAQKKHILFIGDSFTYGHGVEDHETLPAHFESMLDDDEYYVINLAATATSIDWSVTRLQQWCNTFSENIHAVYFGVTAISRRTHWQKVSRDNHGRYKQVDDLSSSLGDYIDINVYDKLDDASTYYKFDFLSGTSEKSELVKPKHKAYIILSSKVNDVNYCERNLVSVKQKANIYNFNVYVYFILKDLTISEQEIMKENLESNNSNIDIKVQTGFAWFVPEPTENYRLSDGHWNSNGCNYMATKLLDNTIEWYN